MVQCPQCKEPGAYVSSLFIECPNPDCAHYSEKQRMIRIEESLKSYVHEKEEPTPVYGWQLPLDFKI